MKGNQVVKCCEKNCNRSVTSVFLAVIVCVVMFVFVPALDNGFVNLDDMPYITAVHPLSWAKISRVFLDSYEGHYHPLTLLSLGIQYQVSGQKPWAYHFINVFLHILNTLAVFYLVRMLIGKGNVAFVVALLFGVHPVHVEPVAWIASRKDVQYAFFYFLSLIFYVRYIRSGRWGLYGWALGLFVLSILSKGMAIALAPTLLATDYLLKRRLWSRQVLLEKTPFFLIAILFGLVAIGAQHATGYMPDAANAIPYVDQMLYACYGFLLYLRNIVFPLRLSAHYPYPIEIANSFSWISVIYPLLVFMTMGLFFYAWKRSRAVTFGILFFIVNIVLMLKFVVVSDFIVADRYNYVASMGIFLILGIAYDIMMSKGNWSRIMAKGLMTTCVLLLGILSYARCDVWQNSLSLWNDVLKNTRETVFALDMRGVARFKAADISGALSDFNRAIVLDPSFARSYLNRGYVNYRLGNLSRAVHDYSMSLKIGTLGHAKFLSLNNRGLAYIDMGRFHEAIHDFDQALVSDPKNFQAYMAYDNRGVSRHRLMDYQGALEDFNHAIKLNRNYYLSYCHRSLLKIDMGDLKGALLDANYAIKLNPEYYLAYQSLALARDKLRDKVGVAEDLKKGGYPP
jgi:protein O-mannosyl-transferase